MRRGWKACDFIASVIGPSSVGKPWELMLRRYDFTRPSSKTFKLYLKRVADGRLFIEVFGFNLIEEFTEFAYLLLFAFGSFLIIGDKHCRLIKHVFLAHDGALGT